MDLKTFHDRAREVCGGGDVIVDARAQTCKSGPAYTYSIWDVSRNTHPSYGAPTPERALATAEVFVGARDAKPEAMGDISPGGGAS